MLIYNVLPSIGGFQSYATHQKKGRKKRKQKRIREKEKGEKKPKKVKLMDEKEGARIYDSIVPAFITPSGRNVLRQVVPWPRSQEKNPAEN